MRSFPLLISILLGIVSYPLGAQSSRALKKFSQLIPGFYTTEAMWKRDSSFFHVHLHIVPIWKDDTDGFWFYLEQAEVKSLSKPYRQVILHLSAQGDKIVSRNLTIKNRLNFAGAWKDTALLQKLTKADIEPSDVCDIIFVKVGKYTYQGASREGGCSNQYKGATYFTNESILTSKSLSSWDRGWKADGQLAWGPAAHGYTFDKISK